MMLRSQGFFLILLFANASIISALKIACLSVERYSSQSKFFPSFEVRKSIAEIARRSDVVLIQGIQENLLNYIQKMLNSKLQGYSLVILVEPNETQQQAYIFQTENIRLLKRFNDSGLEGGNSVLVKDLKGGLPDFVLFSRAKDIPEEADGLIIALNKSASGTDTKVVITRPGTVCRTPPVGDFATKSHETKVSDHNAWRKCCPNYRISAPVSFPKVIITPLQTSCNHVYSSAEFLIESHQNHNGLVERDASSDSPAVLESTGSDKGRAAAEAIGAALGSILIFCTILCVICCCINKRCGYQKING